MRRVLVSIAMLAAGSLLLSAAGLASLHRPARVGLRGGKLLIGVRGFRYIDPALAQLGLEWPVLDATCDLLMRYPDKSPPAGYHPVPGAASAYPKVSRDGKTYTFTIRRGLRFSNGEPLTAKNFVWAINRLLDPAMKAYVPDFYGLATVAGANSRYHGKAKAVSGVTAKGQRLTFRLTRPTGDLVAAMTLPYFCPVTRALPVDPEGVSRPFPGSGPYYVAKFVQDQLVRLKRNRFYRGRRPHHVDQIEITGGYASGTEIVREIERNGLDGMVRVPVGGDLLHELAGRYGVNKSRLRIVPGKAVWSLYFNVTRPLFKNNATLRRAIGFAIDRKAIVQTWGPGWGNATDQYLPPRSPGFRNARIYPLDHPDLRRARALASGHRRGGKAVLYTADGFSPPALAQVVQQNLSRIGIQVDIREFASYDEFITRAMTSGEPWDIMVGGIQGLWMDPFWYLDIQLGSRYVPGRAECCNNSYFASRHFDRLLRRADRLSGAARYRAYGNLDVETARTAAPMAAFGVANDPYFFSNRVGCIAANFYGWDIAAACLKHY